MINTFQFVFCHDINVKEIFSGVQAEKGIGQHIDRSSVLWTLIDNGKLPNQIATFAAIVVKNCSIF